VIRKTFLTGAFIRAKKPVPKPGVDDEKKAKGGKDGDALEKARSIPAEVQMRQVA